MQSKKSSDEIQYGFIDMMKFLLALLIVSAHYISEYAVERINRIVDFASSLYIIVVPFFFVCSGFLLFRKIEGVDGDTEKIKRYCVRILVMYGGWSLIYFFFVMLTWIRFGTTVEEVLLYLLNAVTYSSYKTIWFLPATVIGVLITWWGTKTIGIRGTAVLAASLYTIGCLGASYSFLIESNRLLEIYNYIFFSTRNGVFNGFPFVFVGYLIAKKSSKEFVQLRTRNLLLTCFFAILFVFEALIIKKMGAVNVNTLFLLVPFSLFFFQLCLGIEIRVSEKTKWLRRMSTDVFLCQRLFLSSIPGLFPESVFTSLLEVNPYTGWFLVTFLTLMTAAVLVDISKHNSFIAQFC